MQNIFARTLTENSAENYVIISSKFRKTYTGIVADFGYEAYAKSLRSICKELPADF